MACLEMALTENANNDHGDVTGQYRASPFQTALLAQERCVRGTLRGQFRAF